VRGHEFLAFGLCQTAVEVTQWPNEFGQTLFQCQCFAAAGQLSSPASRLKKSKETIALVRGFFAAAGLAGCRLYSRI